MMKRRIAAFLMILLLFAAAGCENGRTGDKMSAAPTPSAVTNDVIGLEPGISDEAVEKANAAQPTAVKPAVNPNGNAVSGTATAVVNGKADPVAVTADKEKPEAGPGDTFGLYLTRDWGSHVLDSRNVIIKPDYNLLNYMKEEWQITAGAGGFISGINGLKSDKSGGNCYDWFFYVNGASSMVGASQVKPGSGDVIYWDYHMWSNSSGIIKDEVSFPPKDG